MRIKRAQQRIEKSDLEAKARNIRDNSALVDLLVEVIKNAVVIGMRDIPKLLETRVRIGTKVDTIDRAANDIRKEISKVVSLTKESEDFIKNEHAYEVYRLLQLMAFLNTEELTEFNDNRSKLYQNGK